MIFQKNVSLKKYTTFKIGGPAKYFFTAETKPDLVNAIRAAKKMNLPFFVLGGGSNLLVSDKGFNGLVIKIQNSKFKIQNSRIFAESGLPLSQLVNFAFKNSLTGLEWAAGIPGTVGGAIFGNAGAFSKSMGDVINSVEVFNTQKNCIQNFKNKDCRFGYRQSVFKKNRNFIILSCTIELQDGDRGEIKEEMRRCLYYRDVYHPKGFSAGSVFVNPKGYAAKELIETCGLKGKKIGGAQISIKHPNFIINSGGAKTDDVLKLINLIKKTVDKKFKVKLQEEIIVLK